MVGILCGGRDGRAGLSVRAEIDEADLAERGLADDVERTGVLLAVDDDRLPLLDELELIDACANGSLPGETVL